MKAFMDSDVGKDLVTDDTEAADDEERAAIERKLEEDYDYFLEEAATMGFNIGSHSAVGRRYALWRASCEKEN
eukprot:3707566-Pyramimonas_sp.AAC.2